MLPISFSEKQRTCESSSTYASLSLIVMPTKKGEYLPNKKLLDLIDFFLFCRSKAIALFINF